MQKQKKKSIITRAVSVAAALIMISPPAENTAFAEAEEETSPFVGGVSELLDAGVKYADEDTFIGVSRSSYADTTASDSAFFDACDGTQWGYFEIAKRSNGAKRQELYNQIRSIAVSIWNDKRTFTGDKNKYGDTEIFTLEYTDKGLTYAEAVETYLAFQFDNPEFYYLSKSFGQLKYKSKTNEYLIGYTNPEYLSGSKRASYNTTIKNYLAATKTTVSKQGTLYKKALAVETKLMQDMSYAYSASGGVSEKNEHHNVVGAIVSHKGVCEGYAKTFHLMANYCGLDDIYIIGSAKNNAGQTGSHAWNLTHMDDGKYYYVDVTWNDYYNNSVRYFAKGTNALKASHFPSPSKSSAPKNFFYSLPSVAAADFDSTKTYTHTCTFGSWNTKLAPTCTAQGTEVRKCTICGKEESRTVSAKGHTYAAVTVEATCTEKGYTAKKCRVCGAVTDKKETTAAGGHSFGSWKVLQEQSCTSGRILERSCTKCGKTEKKTTLDPLGHDYKTTVINPTETTGGYTEHKCSRCGDTYKDNEVPRLAPPMELTLTLVYSGAAPSPKGAAVAVKDAKGRTAASAAADASGKIKLDMPEDGSYKAVFSLKGFAPREYAFTVKDAKASLTSAQLCRYGDLNGDGKTDSTDITLFQQWLGKWNVEPVYEGTADMNGDGTADIFDLALLQQYVSSWTVSIGK